ncbi:MAG: hypothetical protein QNL88_14605 [Acidobacteriota bacterium]|nr:hypothetical protein [Acidobacteriota bacterium]
MSDCEGWHPSDGRWISFSRRYGETWPTTTDAEIYWMDAAIIKKLREG